MIRALECINKIVWGIPALLLVLGVGIFLSIRTGFAQVRLFPAALKAFVIQFKTKDVSCDGVSPYQALCTALAATVGTGNLAGVAGAIAIGGPGALFWMWVCAFFGMVTKFAEAVLAVKYQVRCPSGELQGGPMHMIEQGMGRRWRWLACLYCFFGVVAAFGVGNATQINAVIGGINSAANVFGIQGSDKGNMIVGIGLAVLICSMLLGGAKRIGQAAEKLVPFAAGLYILLCLGVLAVRFDQIPAVVSVILRGAFSPRAVTGGVVGSGFQALRIGASRGVFTNEAGMGTAAIAHGSANVKSPVQQGLMGIVEVFLDTVVICTLTGLVILCSGIVIPYGTDTGIALTADAFSSVYGSWVKILIALTVSCLAFATVLGWGLYGIRCAQYLFGENSGKWFVILQGITAALSAVLKTGTVWLMAETVNGLMLIPNLIALTFLSGGIFHKSQKKITEIPSYLGDSYSKRISPKDL